MESKEARLALASGIGAAVQASRFWRITLALLLGSVIYLALDAAPPQPIDTGWDKLNHVLAFAALAAVGALGFLHNRMGVAAGLLAFGALLEVLQSLTPSRSASSWDLLADALGVVLGFGLAHGILKIAAHFSRQK